MKVVNKSLRPKFNEVGRNWGLILISHASTGESMTLWTDRIDGVETRKNLVIVKYRNSSHPQGPVNEIPIAVNYDVYMKALLIAEKTKYTLDIRPICNLPRNDRYSLYNGGEPIPAMVENRLLRMIRASRITRKTPVNHLRK
jgi:hypothetical protein